MKNLMTLDRLDAETALELPNREMLLVTIVVNNVLNNNTIEIDIKNNNVAAQVCAAINLITARGLADVACELGQS